MPAAKSNQPAVKAETPPAFRQLLGQMELEASAEDDEFGSPLIAGVVKILEAETETDMWDADDLTQTGGRDLVDVEQEILAYSVKYSTNQDIVSAFIDQNGRRMYLLIRSARVEDGAEFVWNTSAPLVVGKIFWLASRNMIPGVKAVIRARDLGGGQALLRLRPIPKRAVQPDSPF